MDEAPTDKGPRNSSGNGGISGQAPAASGSVAAPPAPAAAAERIQLPVWTKVLGWCGIAGLIYLLICAVSIISRGFAGLSGDAAHSMFAFAENPWVGLSVGVLGMVLIQSSTTTTAIAVTAVGAGALPIRAAIPVIIGANLGTTVTPTLVALTFVGSRTEFRRALGASTIHDFYNWLALLIFFPIELIWHPLERISGTTLTNALYGTGWLPDPASCSSSRAWCCWAARSARSWARSTGRASTPSSATAWSTCSNPGHSAVVIMASKITEDKFASAMQPFGGTILKTSLSESDEKELAEELTGQS